MKSMNRGERALLLAGLSLLALYGMSELYRVAAARVAVARFKAVQTTASSGSRVAASKRSGSNVDFRLWSEARIQAYLESLANDSDLPVAVLRYPEAAY